MKGWQVALLLVSAMGAAFIGAATGAALASEINLERVRARRLTIVPTPKAGA